MLFLLLPLYVCAYTFDWQSTPPDPVREERLQNAPYIAISLGKNCGVASRFSEYKIRCSSFPFDWLVTPFETLYDLIAHDFADFLNPENFLLQEEHIFVDKKFNIKFYHDFKPSSWRGHVRKGLLLETKELIDEYQDIYDKYCRRVASLYFVLHSQMPVYLFRTGLQKEEAFKLYELLTTKFENKSIVLVALRVEKDGRDEEWLQDKIYCFSLGKDGKLHESAKQDHPDWRAVFNRLNLIDSTP